MIRNMRRRLMHARTAEDALGGNAVQLTQSRRSTNGAGRRVLSLFSVGLVSAGIMTAGLTAGIVALGAIGATPANAEELNGYYTSGDNHSGFCMDPGAALPTGVAFSKGTKFGNDVTKVFSWFATHYGPEYNTTTHTSGPNPAGGGGYPGPSGVASSSPKARPPFTRPTIRPSKPNCSPSPARTPVRGFSRCP